MLKTFFSKILLATSVSFISLIPALVRADTSPKRHSELITILKQDCGSCHGMTLNGGLGKPITPETLKDKDESYLKVIILDGVKGTAMPPWRPLISEADAAELARILKTGEAYEPKK